MYKLFIVFSVFFFINDSTAQYEITESIPQTTKLTPQSPTYKIIRNTPPRGIVSPQAASLRKPKRYTFRKVTNIASKPTRRLAKRQYMAESLKQQAIRNLLAAKNFLNKEPFPVNSQINRFAAPANVPNDILVWRT